MFYFPFMGEQCSPIKKPWSISVFNYISPKLKNVDKQLVCPKASVRDKQGLFVKDNSNCFLQAVKNWFISSLWQESPLRSQISIALLWALAQVTANVIIILNQFAYFNKYKLVVQAGVEEQRANKYKRWKGQNSQLHNSVWRGFGVFIFWQMTICNFKIKRTVISCQAKNTDRTVIWLLQCNYILHQLE